MDLEFGLFDWVDATPGRPVAEVYDARLRVLAEADADGFATYHLRPERSTHGGARLRHASRPGTRRLSVGASRPA